jgi:hypothetical protein
MQISGHRAVSLRWMRFAGVVLTILALALSGRAAQAQWTTVNGNTPAAIRIITRSSGGRLIGGRVGGAPNAVEVWASDNNGTDWYRTGTVAGPTTAAEFGDACFLSDGGTLVYAAFREHWGNHWQITICRSVDGGNSWVFDSVVDSNDNNRFLGAPYLWFSRDGTVQCYYDSEKAAANAGRPGYQWIFMKARPKFAFGGAWNSYSAVASRPSNTAVVARDGLPSVVNLDGSTMMLVCEGVDPNNPARNCLFAIKSFNNGRTWDFATRQKIWAPFKNGVQFNAYDAHAVRYGNGPVGVVFCTDDDFASPSPNNAPPHLRNAHVKFIRTLATFEQWGDLQTVETGQNSMYSPGLFEISFNTLLSTIDFYGGRQVIKRR